MKSEVNSNNNDSILLKVAGANQRDVGKGVARIDEQIMSQLGVRQGEVLKIEGEKETVGLAARSYAADRGLDIIRMDGLMRSNAGVGMGDKVQVAKADWKRAEKITVAPAKRNIRLRGSGKSLISMLKGRPVTKGDYISTSIARSRSPFGSELKSSDFFKEFFDSSSFGLGEIRLRVVSTHPSGIVRVARDTEVELLPEYQEVREEERPLGVTYEDIGGLDDVIQKVREMVELPLKKPELFDRLGIEPPKGVLLHGPPGTGKTLLAKAVASESEAHFMSINGPEIMSKFYGESEKQLRKRFQEAKESAPSIIFIDELDSIGTKREEVRGEVERRVVAQLLALMDGLEPREEVIVIGATNRVNAVDEALRRPGRFDREIEVGVPDGEGRKEIFLIHTRGMPLDESVDLDEFVRLTYGFTGSDIEALCRESAMNALRRVIPKIDLEEEEIPAEVMEELIVNRQDMDSAFRDIDPSALREILAEVPQVSWDDIGGLDDVKQTLHEAVEMPLRRPDSFERIGINPPKGVLLYGPPGTGKTMLAKAVANESDANFITAKGSDLLSKWYGESEQRIAEVFNKARQVAPSVIFLDELDALAPKRGESVGHVTERIVNQLLSEMDGLEELRGVVVVGATNRPDIVDPALLRPGRFDELIQVPVPDRKARQEIFEVHTRNMALSGDVDLDQLIEKTTNYTGADIRAICEKAGRLALRDDIESEEVRKEHFEKALEETHASATPETKAQYEGIQKKLKQEGSKIGFTP